MTGLSTTCDAGAPYAPALFCDTIGFETASKHGATTMERFPARVTISAERVRAARHDVVRAMLAGYVALAERCEPAPSARRRQADFEALNRCRRVLATVVGRGDGGAAPRERARLEDAAIRAAVGTHVGELPESCAFEALEACVHLYQALARWAEAPLADEVEPPAPHVLAELRLAIADGLGLANVDDAEVARLLEERPALVRVEIDRARYLDGRRTEDERFPAAGGS